jgi:hypothetical protein
MRNRSQDARDNSLTTARASSPHSAYTVTRGGWSGWPEFWRRCVSASSRPQEVTVRSRVRMHFFPGLPSVPTPFRTNLYVQRHSCSSHLGTSACALQERARGRRAECTEFAHAPIMLGVFTTMRDSRAMPCLGYRALSARRIFEGGSCNTYPQRLAGLQEPSAAATLPAPFRNSRLEVTRPSTTHAVEIHEQTPPENG